MCVYVCGGDFNQGIKYNHCISKKIKSWFVSMISECSMVFQNCNEYHGDKICYIVIYDGVLCNIGILCWNMICVRLQ